MFGVGKEHFENRQDIFYADITHKTNTKALACKCVLINTFIDFRRESFTT